MNINKSRFFTRFVAAPIAAAGILGGAAVGVAAAANADPGPSGHTTGGHSSEFRPSDDSHRDFRDYRGFRPDFWDFWTWNHHRDHHFYGWHRDS